MKSMICLVFLSVLSETVFCQVVPINNTQLNAQKTKIRVGIAAAETSEPIIIGWPTSGGAINLALERLRRDGYADQFDFEFIVNYTECQRDLGASIGMELMRKQQVNVVIGPPCQNPMEVMATMSAFYKIPILGWGLVTASKFTDSERYPYFTNMVANSLALGNTLLKLFEKMEWNRIALLYETDSLSYTLSLSNDIESAMNSAVGFSPDVVVKEAVSATGITDAQYVSVLNRIKSRARVIVYSVLMSASRRKYLQMIREQGMDTDEYVHIMPSLRSIGYGKLSPGVTLLSSGLAPFWEAYPDDGLNEQMKLVAARVFVIDLSTDVSDKAYLQNFTNTALSEITKPPISCQTAACLNLSSSDRPSSFSRTLHDIFYLYGMAISNLYKINSSYISDPVRVISAMQLTFQGLTGEVVINSNHSREPKLKLYSLDRNYDEVPMINMTYSADSGTSFLPLYSDESLLWYWYNGKRPLSVPVCGFLGTNCPKPFLEQYGALTFSVGGVLVFFVVLFIFFLFYIVRQKNLEYQRINAEWQIPHTRLLKPPKKEKERQSKRSLQSGPSTITENSKMTFDSEFSNYIVYYLDKDPVLTTKHPSSRLFNDDYDHVVKLRKLDHDNVNKFIGISIDGLDYIVVWKMCMRGSLQDIIVQGNFSIDPFFMFCIIRDIAEGMKYLHESFLHVHGNLRSATVLVNESWQAKLTDYGVGFLMEESKPLKKRQLWTAPEVIRGALLPNQIEKPADVYSFSIICSEILTRKPAWNLDDRKESVDELLYMIKKGGNNPIRPELDLDGIEVNVNLLHLVRDCWSEAPEDRPMSTAITNMLMNMMPSKKTNLMDHVFNILEEYTSTLEMEVEERTKELSTEKKKADILLGRMLPKQVAERLKMGQTVEPEQFDSVTVFFSDVVKFTQLAAKCSPFQVVNLLNDLYGNFDAIIEEHENYKVESIGDGYLCVSGLPVRNGNAHIKQIIEMSIEFMNYCKSFKVPHLPREKVELRIGVNSGPCVAGVVGLSMPRYCLFGDTVNTASRMESNGKPSHIHMSAAAHNLLNANFPNQYETESRGDVIIKGKGVMETFWAHRRKGDNPNEPLHHLQKTPSEHLANSDARPEKQRKPSISSAESPSSSKRSISPILDFKTNDDETEALYRQFIRRETLPIS